MTEFYTCEDGLTEQLMNYKTRRWEIHFKHFKLVTENTKSDTSEVD